MHFNPIFILFFILISSAIELTDKWQIIPDDEMIPGGAHIRLDMESGLRQAKLAHDSIEKDSEIIVRPGTSSTIENQSEQALFIDAINSIKSSTIDNQKLENLADLSHDIEFGHQIIKQAGNNLLKIIDNEDKYHESIRDVTARILGASTRNNPQALEELFKIDPNVVGNVLKALENSKLPRIASRLVSVLSSLVETSIGMEDFKKLKGDEILQKSFMSSSDIKKRIIDFIQDHILSSDKNDWRRKQVDEWWNILQKEIITDLSIDTKLRILQVITEMKKENRSLAVDKNFVSWLAGQAIRESDDSMPYTEKEFLKFVKEVRHVVFGNPKATRKQFDEL